MMFEPYKVSEENEEVYRQLCQRFHQSDGLFQCQHRDWMAQMELEEDSQERDEVEVMTEEREDKRTDNTPLAHTPKKQRIEKNPSLSSGLDSDLNETLTSGTLDFKSLQKNIVANINTSAKLDFGVLQSIDPKTVCESGVPSPADEALVQVCKKCEKLGDNVVNTVCMLLILPKLYHLKNKLATSICDAMMDFARWHPSAIVTHALVPLLQYCPNMQEQHRDALAQLMQGCSASLVTQMLSAMSTRESTSDIDIQIFQQLCEKANHQAQATHEAALTYLGKSSETHNNSIKFGHCLLFVVKKMGSVMQDREGLQHIVNHHSSSLKKAIEVQLKKIDRNR